VSSPTSGSIDDTVTGEEPLFEDESMSVDTGPQTNAGLGMIIAGFAFLVGFGLIWHIWWLAVIGFVGIVVTLVVRSLDEDTETCHPD